MRLSSIFLSLTSLVAVQVLAGATGSLLSAEDLEKRGCNTGNWCCTIASPSSYCIKYCAAGSKYINCSKSYVSTGNESRLENPWLRCTKELHVANYNCPSSAVPGERTMPMQMYLRVLKINSTGRCGRHACISGLETRNIFTPI